MATATLDKRAEAAIKTAQTKNLIGGKWVNALSGRTFATYNPATEDVIAHVAEGDRDDIDMAVAAARKAFESKSWRKMDARDRGRLIYKLADLIERDIEQLAALETLDNGKPISESLNGDIPLVIDCLRYYAGWADKLQGSVVPIRGNNLCYIKREPVGVAGQIIPWNFPMLMVAWKWAPALAAGCTIVLKPAEQTPLTALKMGELAMEAGFPDGVINIVNGFGETAGDALVKHRGVDKIAFTGEGRTAEIIMANAAPSLKRLTFELGGKSPNIVFDDADMDAAIDGAMLGLYLNQGQCCCAGSRLFVQEKAYDEFVSRLADKAKARRLGDPFDSATEQGPQVDQAQFDKIMSYIDSGRNQGAKCVAGGERFGDKGYFIKPTIFADVNNKMTIAQEEIFGPVLSMIPYDTVKEAIDIANDTIYGLNNAVASSDLKRCIEVGSQLKSGMVMVNGTDLDFNAPFGGYKQSGNAREWGVYGLEEFVITKTVNVSVADYEAAISK